MNVVGQLDKNSWTCGMVMAIWVFKLSLCLPLFRSFPVRDEADLQAGPIHQTTGAAGKEMHTV